MSYIDNEEFFDTPVTSCSGIMIADYSMYPTRKIKPESCKGCGFVSGLVECEYCGRLSYLSEETIYSSFSPLTSRKVKLYSI